MPIQMTRAEYEAKYGKSAQPKNAALIEAVQTPDRSGLMNPAGFAKDFTQDLGQYWNGVSQAFTDRRDTFQSDRQARKADGKVTFGEGLGSALGLGAATVGAVSDAVGESFKLGAKALLSQEQEDFIVGGVKNYATKTANDYINHPTVGPITVGAIDKAKELVSDYNEWTQKHPELARNVRDTGTLFSAFAELALTKGGIAAGDESLTLAKQAVKSTAPMVDGLVEARRVNRLATQTEAAKDATGKILQSTTDDVEPGLKAFTQSLKTKSGETIAFDRSNIKGYKDVSSNIDTTVEKLSREMDTYLSSFSDTKLTKTELGRFEQVGGKTVISTPVQDALDQMKKFYAKTNQAGNEARIDDLIARVNSEGITLKELNQIAQEHGQKLNAFNVNGELASGLPKQAAENTRKGVKEVLRQRLPDDYSKQIDSQLSNLLNTKAPIEKMVERVNKVQQRIIDEPLGKKFAKTVFDLLDMASLRTVSGITSRFGSNSTAKYSLGNAIDLEKQLSKQFAEIDSLMKITDKKAFSKAVEEWTKETQIGMSIKNSVRPDKIAGAMDDQDLSAVKEIIGNPDLRLKYEGMIDAMGLTKATDEELVSFLKEVLLEKQGGADRMVIE